MPDRPIAGLHHVTALSGAAQANLDFYAGVLGLRRVKTTVNFDDPKTPHLYYGDATGRPGTITTVFPWPQARPGRAGAGMATSVAFAVPPGTLGAWADRLDAAGVPARRTERFGTPTLTFDDPAGLPLALVADADGPAEALWTDGPVPADRALRGLHAPTLPVFPDDRTPELLTTLFGWTTVGTDEDRLRLRAPDADVGGAVDLQVRDRHPSGRMGQGTVHHVAFRARDAQEQQRWREALRERGIEVTEVKDRRYFQSIYFRHASWTSGLLFEIATDGPGFQVDEPEATLGEALQLPSRLEPRRDELEHALPSLSPPSP
ncbi:MAG: ring-cleaving dioxygenase [Salinibacter sp.]